MAKSKAQKKKSSVFWRVAISAVGAALILIAVFQLLLYFSARQRRPISASAA
jgi:anti-sigma-K factor RskA